MKIILGTEVCSTVVGNTASYSGDPASDSQLRTLLNSGLLVYLIPSIEIHGQHFNVGYYHLFHPTKHSCSSTLQHLRSWRSPVK